MSYSDCPPKKMRLNESRTSRVTASKRKFCGAANFKTRFNPTWTKKWRCIVGVTGSEYEFKCTVCCKICSCGHQGETGVSRHFEGAKHKERVKSASTSRGLLNCGFRKENDPISDQVIRAETKVALLIGANNVQMAFADKLSDVFKDLFPDSRIAKEYGSKRTKATCILNEALAPRYLKNTVEMMKNDFFSLLNNICYTFI